MICSNNKVMGMILVALLDISCSRKSKVVYLQAEAAKNQAIGSEIAETRKVDIVSRIEPILPIAIKEQWTREMWIAKAGRPSHERDIMGGGHLLEYCDSGPYKASGNKLITGVIVYLKDGVTDKCEWNYTYFR